MTPAQIKDWIDVVLRPVHLLAVALLGGFLLLSPDPLILRLGLADFIKEYGGWVGLSALASVALLVARGIPQLWRSARSAQLSHGRKKYLEDLAPNEKNILKGYLENNQRSQTLPVQDGHVAGLERMGIISRASSLSVYLNNFDFIIQPWARKYLEKNPDLLK